MKVIVLKIGGSCLTYKKEGIAKIRNTFLDNFVKEIKDIIVQDRFSLVIVHGGGSMTHPLLDKYGVAEKLKNGSIEEDEDMLSSAKIHLAMNRLNNEVVQALIGGGISSWPFQSSALFSSSGRNVDLGFLRVVRLAIKNGYVPVLHGDLVLDKKHTVSILSGDLVATILAKKLGADKLLFASDVDGVFLSGLRSGKKGIVAKNLKKEDICLLRGEGKSLDHSGGMISKLKYINDNCRNMEVIIFNGLKRGALKKAFFGEIGTKVNF